MKKLISKQLSIPRTIKDIITDPRHFKEPSTINGWVTSVRKLKNVAFIEVSDGSCSQSLPLVTLPSQAKNIFTGTTVQCTGLLKTNPKDQKSLEFQPTRELTVLGDSGPDYPLQKKFHTNEFLRTIPEFRLKTRTNTGILRYRSYAMSRISSFFEENRFVQVNSPLVTSSDCEGAGEVFSLRSGNDDEFFGKKAYLSVSSQLHLEVYAAALSRVWNLVPAFRAEESDTNRHLSEFTMVEAEIAFVEDVKSLSDIAEEMVRQCIPRDEAATSLLNSIRSEEKQKMLENRWKMLSRMDEWPRITYTKAIEILKAEKGNNELPAIDWSKGLASLHEKFLAGEIFNSPIFVTDYPTRIKPFYMKKSSENTAAAFDLLLPDVGELIGGSLREDDYETLLTNMTNHNMNTEDLSWYLNLRKFGTFPHGGFGMGFDRMICFMCGVENIRDAVGFPRWSKHIKC